MHLANFAFFNPKSENVVLL